MDETRENTRNIIDRKNRIKEGYPIFQPIFLHCKKSRNTCYLRMSSIESKIVVIGPPGIIEKKE